MSWIWATRGKNWGFRFLASAGLTDPLPTYEAAFAGVGDDVETIARKADRVAVRFTDPKGRRDRAGRLIPHEFVFLADDVARVQCIDDARGLFWPLVADWFEGVWDAAEPPEAFGAPQPGESTPSQPPQPSAPGAP